MAISGWENKVMGAEIDKKVCGKWTLRKEFHAWLGLCLGFLHTLVSKEPACNAGDLGSIPGTERSPGEGNSNPLQYSCLEENPIDGGAWQLIIHAVTRVGHD